MARAHVLRDGLTLPEAPRWHEGRLWFSDLYSRRVYSTRESGDDLTVEAELTGPPVGLGWLPDGRLLVVAQDQRRIMRREPDGSLVEHADLGAHAVGYANDMVVTADGVAFVGCFGFDLYHEDPVQPAPLMRVTPDGGVTLVGEPLFFANGLTFVDGATLVIAESFGNRLSAFDIGPDARPVSRRRDWATFGPLPTSTALKARFSELAVAADGISGPDADGAIWVADFTKPWVSRVLPGGQIVEQVTTGDLNCFAAALGGEDGRTLFLCAAPDNLDATGYEEAHRGAILSHRVAVPAAS